jgi:PAS domain S-box-containing protein
LDVEQAGSGRVNVPSGREFARLLDAIPEAVLVASSQGTILLANQQAELMFGYARAELVGRAVEVLLPERFRAAHGSHRAAYMEAPRVRPMGAGLDLFGLRKDGTELAVEISLSPVTLGGEVAVISTIRDVTERRELEQARQRLVDQELALSKRLQAVQSISDAALANLSIDSLLPDLMGRVRTALETDTASILLLDDQGQILIPRAAAGLEEEVEQQVRIPMGEGFAGRVAAERRAIAVADTGNIRLANPILREKGIRSLLGVPLIVEGRLLGVLHVGTLTRREFSVDDQILLRLVTDRIALAVDRAQLHHQAETALTLRNEFLSAISHDLGNPVAAVRFHSRTLLDEAQSAIESNLNLLTGLKEIHATARRTWGMVEEMLDLARLQVGRPLDLNWTLVDLVAMLRELVDGQQSTTDRHRLNLDITVSDLSGEWDGTRLERVIMNLLSNAVKYSPDGGEILVRLSIENDSTTGQTWAVLEIVDHGIGIPAEDLPHVFERFRRGSNADGRFPGTGIGLSTARQIVEHHGGALTLESEEGSGTTVRLRLPCGDLPE